MNKFQELIKRYSLRIFYKKAKKVHFKHNFVSFEKAKTFAFIININKLSSRELINITEYITRLEDQGKTIYMIELNFKKKTEPMFRDNVKSIFVNPVNLNWLGFPSRQILEKINSLKIDILLNLDTSEKMTAGFICGLSNAQTRGGIFDENLINFYELMLELPPETRSKELLRQFETYTRMIEK